MAVADSHNYGSLNIVQIENIVISARSQIICFSMRQKLRKKSQESTYKEIKNVQQIIVADSDSDEKYYFKISQTKNDVFVSLDDKKVELMIDSGGSCNIIDG